MEEGTARRGGGRHDKERWGRGAVGVTRSRSDAMSLILSHLGRVADLDALAGLGCGYNTIDRVAGWLRAKRELYSSPK